MHSAITTDTELWIELISGNERAFSLLFKRHYPSLINYGKSITLHHNLVGDCIQDVFADVWLYRQKLIIPDSVKAYLLSGLRKRIARKIERDSIFKRSTGIDQLEFSATFTVLDQLITDEETQLQVEYLNILINKLPPRQKEALYLRYYQQLSIDQIADMMQMNYQSVVNLLHRAIKQLRNVWKGELPQMFILFTLAFA